VDGHLVWIQDAYTTTAQFPYSQSVNLSDFTLGMSGTANYVRNSVKVVVDAFSGAMRYYVVDDQDPIIRVWQDVFPDLFTPVADASADLQAHFRYPEDMFRIQSVQFANYHVTDPRTFYGKQDFWQIPADPTYDTTAKGASKIAPSLAPYYVRMLLPERTSEEFALFLPFSPIGRTNMVAWMAAPSDPGDYGDLLASEFPSGNNVLGPEQVFNQINSDTDFSETRTLLGRGGSKIKFGNFLVIPIDDGFLYVLPMFVQGRGDQSFPLLKRVVVVHGSVVGLGETLEAAIADSFGEQPPPPPPPPDGGGGGTVEEQIKALLADAVRHFQAADAALKAGDLGTYQQEIAAAQNDIERAQALANEPSSPTPTPSGTPTTTPSESPSSTGGASPSPTGT
jgi:uncharacterized membrane protein (UPF0182 family)